MVPAASLVDRTAPVPVVVTGGRPFPEITSQVIPALGAHAALVVTCRTLTWCCTVVQWVTLSDITGILVEVVSVCVELLGGASASPTELTWSAQPPSSLPAGRSGLICAHVKPRTHASS